MKFLLSLALPLRTWAGPCSPNPCNNEGVCQLNGKSYTCHCLEDFVGVQCEFPNPCVSESCSGHGECRVHMAEYNPIKAKEPKAHCECKVGWGGDYCEIEVGCGASARDDPCGTNGRCTTDALEHYACQCELGFEGDRCERIDYCASSPCAQDEICTSERSSAVCRPNNSCDLAPCKNGGRCNVNGESYNCMCAPGWSGDNCEVEESEPCNSTKCINGSCKKRANGTSVCECNIGFEGPHCAENVDDCANHQCYNGGICQDKTGGYACSCTAGWMGKFCELDVDECTTTMGSRCKNGATCQNTRGSYNCLCINGFSGTHCEINDDDCRVNDCAEGSVCVDHLGKYTCKCPPGKMGARCDLTNECFDYGLGFVNPCGNGYCDPSEDGFAVCTCFNGWEGETCEKDIDECLDSPCSPFGTCINHPGSWECKCQRGYAGKTCEDSVDLCEQEKPCFNGGTCIKDAGFKKGYYCSCPPSHEGENCMQRKMHCEKNSCLNGGTCRERYDGFVCSCEKGFEGNNCERRTDYCAQADYPCSNGECHNDIDDYRCICSEGWTGRDCSENVNECAPNPCKNGKCTDYVNDFSCECDEGWEGRLCEKPINPCLNEPCYNGECKVPAPGKFECVCPKGTGGKYCKDNVNECQGVTCEHGGIAKDSVGKCICECKPGFDGQFCQVNIDDCEPNPCLNKGECVDLVSEYKCKCPKGTWGDRCYSNKNACSPSPCYNYGTCVETGVGQFQCKCAAGFGGVNCEIDLCADNGFCQNNGVSVPIGNHFNAGTDTCRCKCPPNFEGKQCEISTVCKARNPCKHGTCRSQDGDNVECVCDAGYSGKYCDTKLDECTNGSVCHNGGICKHDYDNKAVCNCPSGWTGRFCDIDKDECKENKNICKNNGVCENTKGGYYCKCDGFKGKHCENDIDDCAHSPCKNGGSCINNTSGRGFTCDCKSGFSGVRCQEEINECDGNPCLNGGSCKDMVDSYQCDCPSSYRGVRCEIRMSVCAENPCANNGVCSESTLGGELKFNCSCPPGFSGDFCETNIDDCTPNPCLNKGICKDKVDSFKCECNPAFYGDRCEHLSKICQKERGLCQNGGTCIDDGSQDAGYRCVCPQSHGGLHCDVPLDTCEAAAVALKISESQVCKNSGKCQNERHGHSCACKQGFEGDHCETGVNLCKNHVCHNGGECFVQEHPNTGFVPYANCRCPKAYAGLHCEKFIGDALCNKPYACQNGGTCVVDNYNFERGYFCICPYGISGDNCEINEDDCLKPTSDGEEPCMGHGKCTDGITPINGQYGYFNCNCIAGYEGSRCEATTNYCHQNTCNDVGTANCRPILNDFVCECKHGYHGHKCQEYTAPKSSPCDEEDPCMNGSICSLALYTNTGFKCHCVEDGTYGERCEQNTTQCGALSCYNSDSCAREPTGEETCECRVGYTGVTCAIKASEQACLMPDSDKCQPKCNVKECDYCDGQCALGQKDPWDSCNVAKCRNLFNNGRCDKDCNNEDCMFDGRDCEQETSRDGCEFESYCATIYGNGKCDEACNTAACGWDGLDCLDGEPKDIASGSITVLIDMKEDNLSGDQFWKLVERDISISMKSNVFIVSTEAIDPYQAENENRGDLLTSTRHRRVAEPGTSKVVMQIDNRGCAAVSFNCYQEASNFARDMSARRVNGGLAYPDFGMHDIESSSTPYRQPWNNMPMVATIGSLLLVTAIFGALVNRKRKRGTLWEGLGPIPNPPSKRTKNGQGQLGYYDKGKSHEKNSFMYGQSPPYMGAGNIYNPKGNNVDWTQHGFPITSEEAPMLGYAEPNSILAQKGPDGRDIMHIMSIQADHTYTDEEMQNLLKSGICPNNQTERYEETPLHLAARSGNASFAQQLLRNGADPGIKDKNGRTPLHVAISSDSKGVFYVLIQNPHLRVNFDEKDESGHTPLITAAKLAIEWGIQELIQQNVDVNVVDNNGKSALHWAAEVNNSAACEQLLKHGANKDLQTEREETPLFLAAREGARECVEVLLTHMAAKDTADIAGRKPEDIAAQRGHDDVVRLLKSAVNSHLYDYNSCQKNASFFNSQKKSIPNKKRSRPDSKNSKNAKRTKPQGGARPAHPYARSISNIPGAYGSSPLTPPNDRNFPYQTLHSQSRLQQAQGLQGFPPAHLTHYMEMNQTMPCTPHSAYKNYDAWTTQVHMAQYTSFHAAAHPTLYSRSFQSPPMNQVQQTSLMADTAVQGSPDYNSPSADNENIPESLLTPSPVSNPWSTPPTESNHRGRSDGNMGSLTPNNNTKVPSNVNSWQSPVEYSPGLNHPKQATAVGQF